MSNFINKPRRIIGVVFLGIAMLMVVVGQIGLGERFSPFGYVFYWLICAVFTVLAASVALVDLVRVKKTSRAEQKELIEDTFVQIERDKREAKALKNSPDKTV